VFGLIFRLGTFAINACLVLLLSEQSPQFNLWDGQSQSPLLGEYRDKIFASLGRVRVDLETNGHLLFSVNSGSNVGLAHITLLETRNAN
jgi:hypothetical protein